MRLFKSSFFSVHIAVLLFGLSALFGRWLSLAPFVIVLGRTVFGALALALLAAGMRESLQAKRKRDYIILLGSGAVLAFHWTAFFESVQTGSVAIATLTFATFPVLTALIEPLLFKEKFQPQNLLAALGAFAGVALMSWPSNGFHPSMIGIIWGLASAASFSVLSLINRGRVQHYPGRVVAFYQNAGAALCLLPFAFATRIYLTPHDMGLLIILGVFCTALAHTLFIHSMKGISATTAGLVACLEPVYAILLAALFLDEHLTWRIAVSGALILISAYLPGKVKNKA